MLKKRKDVLFLFTSIEVLAALIVNTQDWNESIDLGPEPKL